MPNQTRPDQIGLGCARIVRYKTYFCSRIPCPSFQKPKTMTAPMPKRSVAGRNPGAGRLRLWDMCGLAFRSSLYNMRATHQSIIVSAVAARSRRKKVPPLPVCSLVTIPSFFLSFFLFLTTPHGPPSSPQAKLQTTPTTLDIMRSPQMTNV